MAGSETLGVARPDGQHWHIDNLSIYDGSLFPASIGANTKLSVCGIVSRLAQRLVTRLSGQVLTLA